MGVTDRAAEWRREAAAGLRVRVLLLTVVVVLPLAWLVAHMAHRDAERSFAEAQDRAVLLAESAAARQNDILAQARNLLGIVAQAGEILTDDVTVCDAYLRRVYGQYDWLTGISVADPAGRVVCTTTDGYLGFKIDQGQLFQEAVATRKFAWTGYAVGPLSTKPIIGASQPVLDGQGRVVRLAVLGIDLRSLNRQLWNSGWNREDTTVTVIDSHGVLIGRYPEIDGAIGTDVSTNPGIRKVLDLRSGTIEGRNYKGEEQIAAFRPLADTGATIMVSILKQPIVARVNGQLGRDLGELTGLVLIALLVGILASEVFLARDRSAPVVAEPRAEDETAASAGRISVVRLAPVFGGVVALLGATALAGWWFGLQTVTNVLPGLAPIKIVTALWFLAAGVGTVLAADKHTRWRQGAATLLGAALATSSAAILAEYIAGIDLRIDLPGRGELASPANIYLGRPATATAVAFLCAGLSLLQRNRGHWGLRAAGSIARSIGFLTAMLTLVAYSYNAIDEAGPLRAVALPTAIGLLILFIGMELGPCGDSLLRLYRNRFSGGWVARRLIPATIIIPILLGGAVLELERTGILGREFGAAIVAMSTIVAFGVALWAAARLLDGVDTRLRKTLGQLGRANATLEQRVAERTAEAQAAADTALASEALYRLLADNTTDVTILTGRDGKIRYVSPACRRMFGYELDEFVDTPAEAMVHPDDQELLWNAYASLTQVNQSAVVTYRQKHKTGNYHWVESSIRLASGRLEVDSRYVATLRDVTERKRAEEEAGRVFNLLSDAIDVMDDAIAVYDADHRLVVANAAMRSILPDGVGQLIPGNTFPEITRSLREATGKLENGPADQYLLWRAEKFARADGRPDEEQMPDGRWVMSRDFRLRDGGVICVATDITALKNALAAEEAARARSDAANQAKTAFLATMSHEIRTPMNGVMGFAELLLDTELTTDQRRQILLLRDAAKSLLTLINDILDISKIEAGRLDLERLPVNPAALVDGAISIMRSQASAKGLVVNLSLAPDLPAWIIGDPTRLRQLLLNLLSNAVKFTDVGSVGVVVRQEDEDGCARLRFEVVDTGIGVPVDRQHLLFEEFTQIDRSTNRRFGGTGLGLSICKRLAEAMGGGVGVSSEPGVGSTFWFTIELVETPPPEMVSEDTRSSGVGRPARILVAEDLTMNQIIVETMLQGAGHRVTIVANGAEAVSAVRVSDYDLILMDVEMPEMDGIAATEAIRALGDRRRSVPIVALTANAMPEIAANYTAAGMNDHLTKPIDRARLLAMVEKWTFGSAPELAVIEPCEEPAVLDESILIDLENRLGRAKVAMFTRMLRQELDKAAAVLSSPSVSMDVIAGQAHAMVSLAGNLGCMELMTRSRDVMTALRIGAEGVEDLIAAMNSALGRADAALAQRYPEETLTSV